MEDRETTCLKRLILSYALNISFCLILLVLGGIILIGGPFLDIIRLNRFVLSGAIDYETYEMAFAYRIKTLIGYFVVIPLGIVLRLCVRCLIDATIIDRLFPLTSAKDDGTIPDDTPESSTTMKGEKPDLKSYNVDWHGDDFLEFCAAVRYEKNEFNALFDYSGQKLVECTSFEESRLCLSKKTLNSIKQNFRSSFDVHCHPSIMGSAHSSLDFAALIDNGPRFSIVVNKHCTYILEDLHCGTVLRGLTGEIIYSRIEWEYWENSKIWQFLEKISRYYPGIYGPYSVFVCRRVAKRYKFNFIVRPAWKDDLTFFARLIRQGISKHCKLAKSTP